MGVVALALVPRLIPADQPRGGAHLDPGGTVLVTAALTAVVLPLVEGRQHGWPVWTWLSLAAAPLLAAAFVAHQRRLTARNASPLLDLAAFRSRSFSGGLLTQLGFWAGQASYFVVLALYLQQGRGLGPLAAGVLFTVLAVAYLVASMLAPSLSARYGRRVILGGTLLLAGGHLVLLAAVVAVGVGGSLAWLLPGLVLAGAGMGLVISPLAATILSTLDAERAGTASGMLTTTQNVGNSLGVAITGVVFFGTLHGGYAHAFGLALSELALLLLAVAALTRLLPRGA